MKRFTLILLTVLSTVACRKVTAEQQIAKIAAYFDKQDNACFENLSRHEGQKRLDYLTLTLAKEIGATDLWSLENAGENSLVAEFPGRENQQGRFSLLSASLDDPAACATVLNTLRSFKDLRIKPKGNIRALFYSAAQDSAGQSGLGAIFQEMHEAGEMITFEVALSSCDTMPKHTFLIEDKSFFAEQILQVIPPYLETLGSFHFLQGRYPNPNWPVKAPVYRYSLDPAAIQKESAAVSTFSFLLN